MSAGKDFTQMKSPRYHPIVINNTKKKLHWKKISSCDVERMQWQGATHRGTDVSIVPIPQVKGKFIY